MDYGYKPEEVANFHNRITQQQTLSEILQFMREWSRLLYEDIDRVCADLKVTKGARLSGLYAFGACQALAAAKEENGGLPPLTDGQYELDKEIHDSNLAAGDEVSDEYFGRHEEILRDRFHMTQLMLLARGGLMVDEGKATELEIEEYYQAGANKVLYTLASLFLERPER
jgi:hypothetical protein